MFFLFRDDNNSGPLIADFLSTRKMKCQLQKLFISGSHDDTTFADVWALLGQQKDSLETFIVTCPMPFYSNIWSYIARETKVKTLCAHFTMSALLGMVGNSIENLVNIGDPLRNDDDAFWRRFRSRNPNFKSMRMMSPEIVLKEFW